jgi:two-component system cell cycle response regulator
MARVLVVDDDPVQREELVRSLVRAGHQVAEATEANDALRAVLDDPPDLVVLDIRLPDAHGVQVAGAIRAVARTRYMPIILVTAFHDAAAEVDPKRFGAECVLTKPVDESRLLAAMEQCLSRPVDEAQHEL